MTRFRIKWGGAITVKYIGYQHFRVQQIQTESGDFTGIFWPTGGLIIPSCGYIEINYTESL